MIVELTSNIQKEIKRRESNRQIHLSMGDESAALFVEGVIKGLEKALEIATINNKIMEES